MRNLKVSARAALSFMFIALLLVALGGDFSMENGRHSRDRQRP